MVLKEVICPVFVVLKEVICLLFMKNLSTIDKKIVGIGFEQSKIPKIRYFYIKQCSSDTIKSYESGFLYHSLRKWNNSLSISYTANTFMTKAIAAKLLTKWREIYTTKSKRSNVIPVKGMTIPKPLL